jgi:hypothetical protein
MRQKFTWRGFILLVMMLSLLTPTVAHVAAQGAGLEGDDTYVSPQFGYTVTWGGEWQARERDVISNQGGYDTLTLRGDQGTLWIQGQGDTETAAAAVQRRAGIEGSADEIVSEELGGDVPRVEMLVGRNQVLIEGYTLEDTDAVVVIVLSARERDFVDALAAVHADVLFNDGPILTGEDIEETPEADAPADLTGESTEEPEATAEPTEEPEATEDAVDEATATVDEDEDTDEPARDTTPADEDDADADATDAEIPAGENDESDPAESAVQGGTFESTLYDYTVTFDEDVWAVEDEILNESSDGLVLGGELGSLTIWSWDAYGADAEACLQGESDYYGTEDPTVEDWEAAEDAKGDPIEGSGDGYAWGVFTLVYINEGGEETELVDYIECREIPGDDAVVIIFASAPPDLYNDHLDLVLDVADDIEIEGEAVAPGTDETEEPEDEGETGLSGSLFTSPAFGFTVDIPSQWRIVDERLDVDNEELVLTNGVSDVTLWATTDYQGDLAGCVDFAAEESGLDLELDVNADGEPFRGEGRLEAYGNFVYENDEGENVMYFISCRNIVRGESVLIMTQDVPYSEFASQRKFRTEIENAIVMPE